MSLASVGKPLVVQLIARSLITDWSLQGLGMFRMYLSKKVRLHVWAPSKFAVENVSTIHTHPWDFTSTVIAGAITDVVYSDEPVIVGGIAQTEHATHHKQQIVCGPGGGVSGDASWVKLFMRMRCEYKANQSYQRRANEIHESCPKDGTVTIIEREFHEDSEHAYVYYPYKKSWVSAEPRPATSDEVIAMKEIAARSLS
jgi:hypothetical protein